MRRTVETEGKTKEDALSAALADLKASEDRVEVEVMESGASGLFGLGAKPVRLRVSLKDDPFEDATEFLDRVLDLLGTKTQLDVVKKEPNVLDVKILADGDDASLIIGKRGQTLDSLQFLTNLMANRHLGEERVKTLLNVGDFRERREESLKILADNAAVKALKQRKSVALHPMPAFERRIVHTYLSNRENIETYSEGIGSSRQVIVAYVPDARAAR